MSKIVRAVNAMITNVDNISSVSKVENEIFFLYKKKYKWSLAKDKDGNFTLHFYPGGESIETLAAYEGYDWDNVDFVTYKDKDIGTREAKASFLELYTILTERVFGINEALDDILMDEHPF